MLSIIIVNYKTPGLLKDCVASLKETIKKTGYEIIVVDVASDGSTAEALAPLANDINLIELKENTGYSKAVNAGLRAAPIWKRSPTRLMNWLNLREMKPAKKILGSSARAFWD